MARKPPGYCPHRPTDRGYARFGTGAKPTYFPGRYNSPESVAAYRAALARYLQTGSPDEPAEPESPTVRVLVDEFWTHAAAVGLYRKGGRPTGERRSLAMAFRPLLALYGGRPVAAVGPAEFDALRAEMARRGWAESTLKNSMTRVRSLFRWGEGRGLVPPGHADRAAAAARGLGSGSRRRSAGRVTAPRRPADLWAVGAAALLLGPPYCTMIRLQLLNGMRPQGVCAIRPGHIDRSGPLWRYAEPRDDAAKTGGEIHWLGPRAQALLAPYLDGCPPDVPVFRPARRPNAARAGVTVSYYRTMIARACKRLGVIHFSPHRLRHNHATLVRQLYGLDAARARLGHAKVDTTEIYAALDADKAKKIAEEIG